MTHPLRQACQFCGRNVRSLTACQESHGVPTVGEVKKLATRSGTRRGFYIELLLPVLVLSEVEMLYRHIRNIWG